MAQDHELNDLRLVSAGDAKAETNGGDVGIPEVDGDQLFEA